MFGRQDDETDENKEESNNNSDAVAPALTASPPPVDQEDKEAAEPKSDVIAPGTTPTITADPAITDQPWEGAEAPKDDKDRNNDILSPAGGYPKAPSQKIHPSPASGDPVFDIANGDLSSIKIQALDELYPLIDELDLDPEERFRILMMMIQASDNQNLVKSAYDAAHSIPEEKVRAKALLDIVNEINYFTQHTKSES